MKNLLIEASVLEQDRPSGVNYFTDGLAHGLEDVAESQLDIGYFWLNFLNSKKAHNRNTVGAKARGRLQQITLIPQRIYAKLVFLNIAPPLWLKRTEWLLFPNFYIWPTLRRTKKAVIIHDLCFIRYPEFVEDKNRAFLDRVATRSINKADLVISNSEFTTSELVSLAKVPEEKIITLNIPVDVKEFLPELNKGHAYLESRYGINKPYILSLGTLEPRKNLTMLVEAYCLLPEPIRKNYSLVLAGKWGWKITELRDLIESKQREGFDIITPGHIDHDDKATFYRNASYYAITTHYEGFGMPLLEALHCQVPTVAVDIPVLREVGGDACLWSKKETTDIAMNLEKLINDKDLATELSDRAKVQADHYSWTDTATKLRDYLVGNT